VDEEDRVVVMEGALAHRRAREVRGCVVAREAHDRLVARERAPQGQGERAQPRAVR
jgi:hypothetical protein